MGIALFVAMGQLNRLFGVSKPEGDIIEKLMLLIAHSEALGVAHEFAEKHGYEADAHQELNSHAVANLASAFLGGMLAAGSANAQEEIDVTSTQVLRGLLKELHAQGITVYVAHLHEPVLEHGRKTGLIAAIGEDRIFPTTDMAVRSIEGKYNCSTRVEVVEPLRSESSVGVKAPV